MNESILPFFLILLLTIEIDGSTSILKRNQVQDRCQRMQEVQRCSGAPKSWHFDVRVSECRQSSEEECGSIGNRFQTKEDCEKICIDKCRQMLENRLCSGAVRSWHYDARVSDCRISNDEECGALGNRFRSKEDCEKMCPGSLNISARQSAPGYHPQHQRYFPGVSGINWPVDYCNRHCCGQQRPVNQPLHNPCYGGHPCPQPQPQVQPPCHGSHCSNCDHRCPYPCPPYAPPIVQTLPPLPPPHPCPVHPCPDPCPQTCPERQCPCPPYPPPYRITPPPLPPSRPCPYPCYGNYGNRCPDCGGQVGNICPHPCPPGQHCPNCGGYVGYPGYQPPGTSNFADNPHSHDYSDDDRLLRSFKSLCPSNLHCPNVCSSNRLTPVLKSKCCGCRTGTITRPRCQTQHRCSYDCRNVTRRNCSSTAPPTREPLIIRPPGAYGIGAYGIPSVVCPISDPNADCRLDCKHGYKKTSVGCPYCECEESDPGFVDLGDYEDELLRREGVPPRTIVRYCISIRATCRLQCPKGFARDRYGCPICQCIQNGQAPPVDCSLRPSCTMFCEHGFQKGRDGCDICLCSHTSTENI